MSKTSTLARWLGIGAHDRKASGDADRPLPVAGRSTRLTILSRVQAGLLAALSLALVYFGTEPAATREEHCVWASFTGHAGGIRSVAFAPDGLRLATGGEEGAVVVWQVGRGAERHFRKESSWSVCSMAFSPDGRTLAAGDCDSAVTLWDVATGQEQGTLRARSGSILCLAFSADGSTLAVGGGDPAIRLWDLASRRVQSTLLGHRRSVSAVAFAPDGRTLASGCAQGRVKLWDVADGRGRERPGVRIHKGPIHCLAFSPDGSLLASASLNDHLELWDVATGGVRTLPGPGLALTQGVSFLDDGQTLISARMPGPIQVWNIAERRELASLRTDSGARCLAFSRDGRYLAWGDADSRVRVWDLLPAFPARARQGVERKVSGR
jgi:WD40 repeat protein